MPLPNQNIPESKKDKSWMKRCVSAIVKMSFVNRDIKAKDRFCYDIYNGVQNERDYDYLRKVDDYEYPAKVRFVPLLRPKFDRLRAEETKRPFNWRVFTIDSNSINDKNQKRFEKIISVMSANRMQISMAYKEALQNLEEIQMQINSARQQASEEVGQVPPELEQQLRMAEREINMGKYVITHETLISEKELEDIEIYFKYKYKDFLEIIAEKGIKFIMATQNLKDIFNQGFEDKLVVDKEIYFVDWEPGDKDPITRKVNPLGFYYSGDDQIEWVGEGEWCMEERYMTVNQIIDEYGDNLSFQDIEKLKTRSSYVSTHTGIGYGYNGSEYNGTNSTDNCGPGGLYSGSDDYGNTIRVCKTYWQSPRKVRSKKSPNPHKEGSFFTHIISDDEKVRENKGEKENIGYINDIYQGVLIDANIYAELKKKTVVRSNDNFGRVELPYIGRAHNYYTRRPYSLVWAAKDVQILYNIIHYHKELWLALSGVKGFIMDKSQIPEGMSMKEWMYQRKMGVGWIQSVKSGLNRQPTFNQFQNFDDSMGPGIQYLLMMLQHLEQLASSITGVSPQRMGDIAPTDQVGTTQSSIQNSSLVTEIIYYDHEQVKRRVLNRIINLCRKAWKKGKRGSYVLGDFAQELLNVPEKELERADYMVFASDGGKEERSLNEIKAMAHAEQQKGLLTFSNLVKLYNVDNLRELEAKVDKYEELAMQRQQSNTQAERDHDVQLKEMDAELKMMIDKQSEDAKNMMAQLEQAKLEWDMQKFNMTQDFEKYKLDVENETDNKKIDVEENVEMAFLEEQKREANQDFVMQKADLAMKGVEATQNSIQQSQNSKERIKD